MYFLIYFVVIGISVFFGALAGLGGGVIIKPVLDAIGHHPLFMINFFSSVAVFLMSVTSIAKQREQRKHFPVKQMLWLALGCVIGGIIGNQVFNVLVTSFGDQAMVNLVQIIVTVILLSAAILYSNFGNKTLDMSGNVPLLISGVILSALSVFLGIGGGPINVAFFLFVFGMSIKQAAFSSILTIFFAQLSKLITIAVTTGFGEYDLVYIIPIAIAAILGSYVGSLTQNKLTDNRVQTIYTVITGLILLLNIYNAVQILV